MVKKSKKALNILWKNKNKMFNFVRHHSKIPRIELLGFEDYFENHIQFSSIGWNERGNFMLISKAPIKVFEILELRNKKPKIVDTLWTDDLEKNKISKPKSKTSKKKSSVKKSKAKPKKKVVKKKTTSKKKKK